jgi:hypothetical protein
MDKTQIITLILGSAAVGALVSSLMTAWTSRLERKARQQELLLTKSLEMAQVTTKRMQELGEALGGGLIAPEIVTARWYHRQLSSLFATGKIGDEMEKEFHDYIHRAHSELDREDEERRKKITSTL